MSRWSYHELSELTRLHKAGCSPEQIARILGRSAFTVGDKLRPFMTTRKGLLVKKNPFAKISAAQRYREAIQKQLHTLKQQENLCPAPK